MCKTKDKNIACSLDIHITKQGWFKYKITTVFYISLASGPRMLPFDVIFLTRFFFMV